MLTKKFTEQGKIHKKYLASDQKLINERINKLTEAVQEPKASLEHSDSVSAEKFTKPEKEIRNEKAKNVNT